MEEHCGGISEEVEHLVSGLSHSLPSPELVFLGAIYLWWLIFSATRVMFEYPVLGREEGKSLNFPLRQHSSGFFEMDFLIRH